MTSSRPTSLVWFDGSFRGPDQPILTALDHGLMVGDGVFESGEITRGRVFALTRHIERLERSAHGLGLAAPDEAGLRGAVAAVEQEWDRVFAGEPGRLRITWTSGTGSLGAERGPGPGALILAASPSSGHGPARVVTVPWPRNERGALLGLKTTSYAENVVALRYATERGGVEAIFANTQGMLCEGTGTNVVLEDDAGLVTPPLSDGPLGGVTRALVLEWAALEGIPLREESIPFEALARCPHAALTSSSRGIMPIASVDGRDLAPGPLTLAMGEAFARRAAEDVDP